MIDTQGKSKIELLEMRLALSSQFTELADIVNTAKDEGRENSKNIMDRTEFRKHQGAFNRVRRDIEAIDLALSVLKEKNRITPLHSFCEIVREMMEPEAFQALWMQAVDRARKEKVSS